MKTIRWGIIGTGGIAHRFAEACNNTPNVTLAAVASRSMETANAFADEFQIGHRFGSYASMAESDAVDAIYIGVPHGLHAECALLCMQNGKGVLCEKPITLNTRELEGLVAASRKYNVFLMEAMWARVVPGTKRLIDYISGGALGEVLGVQGSFCYTMDEDEMGHHVFKPAYGGGSLLDVGCYALSFASWYMKGEPAGISAMANVGEQQVDLHTCVLMKYGNGAIADLSSAIMLRKPNEGYIFGEKGYIYCRRFYAPQEYEIYLHGQEKQTVTCPFYGNGFEEQIMEASDCIRAGLTQSPLIPHAQSLLIMKQMDEIRRKIGVVYPADAR
ncbi:MAG: Gfo/Idh/MocA family oxidoreductase [Oscillospiraceae bacterium]|jgi:predicted dehydrogenase|nr:Gfo/Idh/MocA family oxidoreductase [Oscillospiraceae bacterium]